MANKDKWNKHWIEVAVITSKLSKDPSTKVGAVLVTPDNRQCSVGYNGFASGVEEKQNEWSDRSIKYEMVIHAEENALLFCPFEKKGCKIYLTHTPCHKCLIRLVQCGISEIYYLHDYNRMGFLDIWNKHAAMIPKIEQIHLP